MEGRNMETVDWIKDVESGNLRCDEVDVCVHCFGMNRKIDMTAKNTIHGFGFVCDECLNEIYEE
jgi:superfamily II helicase